MKKLLSVILAAVMTASVLGLTASAHGHRSKGHHSNSEAKIVYHCEKDCTYCDGDGDGICDECGTKGVCSVKPKAKSRRCHH